MTPEEIKAMVADAIKAALPEAVRATVLDAVKPLAEQVATVQKSALTPDAVKALIAEQGKPAAAAGKKGETDSATEQALQELKAQVEASNKRAAEAERKRAIGQRDADLTQALTTSGIRPEVIPDLLAALPARGLVVEAEDGSFGFQGKDQFGRPTILPIIDGATAWAKSEAASVYRPPVQAQGSGQAPGGSNSGTSAGKIGSLADFGRALGLNN